MSETNNKVTGVLYPDRLEFRLDNRPPICACPHCHERENIYINIGRRSVYLRCGHCPARSADVDLFHAESLWGAIRDAALHWGLS